MTSLEAGLGEGIAWPTLEGRLPRTGFAKLPPCCHRKSHGERLLTPRLWASLSCTVQALFPELAGQGLD